MASRPIQILLVEDNPGDARLLREWLAEGAGVEPFEANDVGTLAAALERLERGGVDLVLLDLSLPDAQGLETVQRAIEAAPKVPMVVLTGLDDEALAISAVQHGAQDYLIKGRLGPPLLWRALRYAMERKRAEENGRQLIREQLARVEAELAERKSRFLSDASRVLSSSLEPNEILRAVAQLVVPRFADFCVIDVVGRTGAIDRRVLRHRDPKRQPLLEETRAYALDFEMDRHPVVEVLRSQKPRLIAHFEERHFAMLSPSPAYQSILRLLGPCSWLSVPLIGRVRSLGALSLASSESGRIFGDEELAFAKELAARAALAMDNALLYDQAQEAIRARDEVMAVVSHDLRNPLNVVAVAASMLERDTAPDDARRRRQIAKLRTSIDRMKRLIQDLLDVSKLEAGRFSVRKLAYSPRALLEEVTELFRPLAAEKSLRLELFAGDDLPELPLDRERILQVFSNVIGNSIKFTPEGGRIELTAVRLDGLVRFSVEDSGPGIRPETLPHIFDRFWRERDRDHEGSGLGLAIAKGIIEAHGGTIWAESEPGHGAKIHFTLPKQATDFPELSARELH